MILPKVRENIGPEQSVRKRVFLHINMVSNPTDSGAMLTTPLLQAAKVEIKKDAEPPKSVSMFASGAGDSVVKVWKVDETTVTLVLQGAA